MWIREELWNGNTESWRLLLSLDPHKSILVWAWTQHREYAQRYEAAARDPANKHLTFVRVPSRAAGARLVAELASQPLAGGTAGA
jgi:hypothetical protein